MSKINQFSSLRFAIALGLYIVTVVIAAFVFSWLQQVIPNDSNLKIIYILCGPALSLFTHMALYLIGVQSLLLVPWLVLGVVMPNYIRIAILLFSATWVCIGLFMYDLF